QPMFRYERQQKGRYRQFVQFGVEAIGVEDPLIDVEILSMLMAFYESFWLKDLEIHINSIGDFDSRKEYQKALKEHFRPRIDEFSDEYNKRIDTILIKIIYCKADKDHTFMSTDHKITNYLNNESL